MYSLTSLTSLMWLGLSWGCRGRRTTARLGQSLGVPSPCQLTSQPPLLACGAGDWTHRVDVVITRIVLPIRKLNFRCQSVLEIGLVTGFQLSIFGLFITVSSNTTFFCRPSSILRIRLESNQFVLILQFCQSDLLFLSVSLNLLSLCLRPRTLNLCFFLLEDTEFGLNRT